VKYTLQVNFVSDNFYNVIWKKLKLLFLMLEYKKIEWKYFWRRIKVTITIFWDVEIKTFNENIKRYIAYHIALEFYFLILFVMNIIFFFWHITYIYHLPNGEKNVWKNVFF